MKNLVYLSLFVALFLISCADEKPTEEQKRVTIETILEEYNECSEHGETTDCKNFTARAICEYNGISDLKNDKGEYVEYHDIYDFVTSDSKWKSLGMATDQESLDNAQKMANDGYPVIAIKTDDEHKFTVLVIQGEQAKSSSWGTKVPNCAAFFPVSTKNSLRSFINKTMNYAWSSPENIQMWVRK